MKKWMLKEIKLLKKNTGIPKDTVLITFGLATTISGFLLGILIHNANLLSKFNTKLTFIFGLLLMLASPAFALMSLLNNVGQKRALQTIENTEWTKAHVEKFNAYIFKNKSTAERTVNFYALHLACLSLGFELLIIFLFDTYLNWI